MGDKEIEEDSDRRKGADKTTAGICDPKPKQENIRGTGKNKEVDKKPIGYKSPPVETQFNNLPITLVKELAKQGGLASKGISKSHYPKCMNCEAKNTCRRAYEEKETARLKGEKYLLEKNPDAQYYFDFKEEWCRCVYEIEGRASIRKGNLFGVRSFISSDPKDLLAKMHALFMKLEDVVDNDPTYAKLINMLYLMQNIYKMKFGEKVFSMSIKGNADGESSTDIKELMALMRKTEEDEKKKAAVDVKVKDVTDTKEKGAGDVP